MKNTKNQLLNGFGRIAFVAIATVASFTFLSSCEDDHNHQHDEEETINSVYLKFTNDSNSQDTFTVFWKDLDGVGGNNPVLSDSIRLKGYASYSVSVEFYNEHLNHKDFINEEISAESNAHLVCYSVEHLPTVVSMSIARTDQDSKGMELGLQSQWKTYLNDFKGDVRVKLKHQPGVKNGDCDPGETDVEVVFPFIIE